MKKKRANGKQRHDADDLQPKRPRGHQRPSTNLSSTQICLIFFPWNSFILDYFSRLRQNEFEPTRQMEENQLDCLCVCVLIILDRGRGPAENSREEFK